jgi:hypothetical protein
MPASSVRLTLIAIGLEERLQDLLRHDRERAVIVAMVAMRVV